MKLEDQLCTFEQAVMLRDFGVYQNSLFYYYRGFNTADHGIQPKKYFEGTTSSNAAYSLYTLSEIQKMLWMDFAGNLAPSLTYYHGWLDKEHINHKTAASLHAALLILFLEEKVFTPEQVNKRLIH